jgi:hypothetical protein
MKETLLVALYFEIILPTALISCHAATSSPGGELNKVRAGRQVFIGHCAVFYFAKLDGTLVGPSFDG